jgi:hypothetical protein
MIASTSTSTTTTTTSIDIVVMNQHVGILVLDLASITSPLMRDTNTSHV